MTTASEPHPPPALRRDFLLGAALLAVAGVYVRALLFTPIEARQGAAQKILYVHATSAIVGLYLAFGLMAIASLLYLWLKDAKLDRVAESSAEVGLCYTTVVLATGPLWGKTIWGAWWTWDARLTLTLFLWFVTAAYLVLRGAIDEPVARARYSAVLAVLAALLIPFIHLSVYLFRTLHPMPIVLKPDRPSLPPEMLLTFTLSSIAFLFFCTVLIRARYRIAVARAMADAGP